MNFLQADARKLPFADDSFDLVVGSPPYMDARLYLEKGKNPGVSRGCLKWIDFMLDVTEEATRVSKGLVIWIVAGCTRDWNYQPGCEGLLYEWWKAGGRCWRPCYWHRVGIPGSGGAQWLRADVEYALCFTKCEGAIPYADNTINGHPPKWAPGGEMSNRSTDGTRANQWTNREGMPTREKSGEPARDRTIRPSHENTSNAEADGQDDDADYPVDLLNGKRITGGKGRKSETTAADPWGKRDRGNNLGGRRADGSVKKGTEHRDQLGNTPGSAEGREPNGEKKKRPGAKQITRRISCGHGVDGDTRQDDVYVPPVLANPGVLVDIGETADEILARWIATHPQEASTALKGIKVGGGLMGHDLAHDNEAPYPVKLAKWFIRGWCPPGGRVLDPFSGSGTTVHAAVELGRHGVGCDLRMSQVELGARRCRDVQPEGIFFGEFGE